MFGVVLKVLFWVILAGYAGALYMLNQQTVTLCLVPYYEFGGVQIGAYWSGAPLGGIALAGAAVGAVFMAIAASGAWSKLRGDAALDRAQLARAKDKLKALSSTVKAQQDELAKLRAAAGAAATGLPSAPAADPVDADDDDVI